MFVALFIQIQHSNKRTPKQINKHTPILGNFYGPVVSSNAGQGTRTHSRQRTTSPCLWGGRILTLHFDYVAGYTDPLPLSNGPTTNAVDNQGQKIGSSVPGLIQNSSSLIPEGRMMVEFLRYWGLKGM